MFRMLMILGCVAFGFVGTVDADPAVKGSKPQVEIPANLTPEQRKQVEETLKQLEAAMAAAESNETQPAPTDAEVEQVTGKLQGMTGELCTRCQSDSTCPPDLKASCGQLK